MRSRRPSQLLSITFAACCTLNVMGACPAEEPPPEFPPVDEPPAEQATLEDPPLPFPPLDEPPA